MGEREGKVRIQGEGQVSYEGEEGKEDTGGGAGKAKGEECESSLFRPSFFRTARAPNM